MRAHFERFRGGDAMKHAFRRLFDYTAHNGDPEAEYEIVVRAATKSRAQEAHYHALIADIADQFEYAGRKWKPDDMKRLLVDAFKHETVSNPENFPGLAELWRQMGDQRLAPSMNRDGFVVLGEQTRAFPVRLAAAFITWLQAFMSDHGITCTDPNLTEREALAHLAERRSAHHRSAT